MGTGEGLESASSSVPRKRGRWQQQRGCTARKQAPRRGCAPGTVAAGLERRLLPAHRACIGKWKQGQQEHEFQQSTRRGGRYHRWAAAMRPSKPNSSHTHNLMSWMAIAAAAGPANVQRRAKPAGQAGGAVGGRCQRVWRQKARPRSFASSRADCKACAPCWTVDRAGRLQREAAKRSRGLPKRKAHEAVIGGSEIAGWTTSSMERAHIMRWRAPQHGPVSKVPLEDKRIAIGRSGKIFPVEFFFIEGYQTHVAAFLEGRSPRGGCGCCRLRGVGSGK